MKFLLRMTMNPFMVIRNLIYWFLGNTNDMEASKAYGTVMIMIEISKSRFLFGLLFHADSYLLRICWSFSFTINIRWKIIAVTRYTDKAKVIAPSFDVNHECFIVRRYIA